MDYNGGASSPDIINWVLKVTDHLSVQVDDCHELEARVTSDKLSLVYYGDQKNALFKTF